MHIPHLIYMFGKALLELLDIMHAEQYILKRIAIKSETIYGV